MYGWLYTFVDLLFTVLTWAIIARALLSWFVQPGNRLMIILNEITEPIIAPIRRYMPRMGMLDLSPLVALILLQILQSVLLQAMRSALY